MGKIIRFPGSRGMPERVGSQEIRAAMPRRGLGTGVLTYLWAMLRLPLFLVMYWLRLPVVLACNLLSVPLLFAFLFAWYAFPDKIRMIVGFGMTSFAAFTVLWTYDVVLMALSPQQLVKSL